SEISRLLFHGAKKKTKKGESSGKAREPTPMRLTRLVPWTWTGSQMAPCFPRATASRAGRAPQLGRNTPRPRLSSPGNSTPVLHVGRHRGGRAAVSEDGTGGSARSCAWVGPKRERSAHRLLLSARQAGWEEALPSPLYTFKRTGISGKN